MSVALRSALSAHWHEEYKATGNALYVWRAFLLHQSARDEIPGWVSEYLLRAAENLLTLTQALPRKPAPAIAEALEMKSPGRSGPHTIFSKYVRHETEVAPIVLATLEKQFEGDEYAKGVATELKVHKSKTGRIRRKFTKSPNQ
jgi:hypothetical protein